MGNQTESKQLDRYEGAMLGVAVGDALGAPLEFMDAEEIRRKYGEPVREMIGGGWLSVEPGEVTDDTQMTLAVAEGIASGAESVEREIGLNFLRWYHTNPKDIGGTCRSVISVMLTHPCDFQTGSRYRKRWINTAKDGQPEMVH